MKCQTILLKKFFGLKVAVYYEAIAMVIFSHVKISSFRAKAHLVVHWCLYNKFVSREIRKETHHRLLKHIQKFANKIYVYKG